jgi:hypothetical protein
MIRRPMMVAAALSIGACGGSKAPAPDTSAGVAPAAVTATVDSTKADSTKLADSLAKATELRAKSPAAKGPDSTTVPGDHDRALKPKFTIDEKTGKVTPIKRP